MNSVREQGERTKNFVSVHQHLIFVHFDLLTEHQYATQAQMNEYKARVNAYRLEATLNVP